jgi:hypothetical protein
VLPRPFKGEANMTMRPIDFTGFTRLPQVAHAAKRPSANTNGRCRDRVGDSSAQLSACAAQRHAAKAPCRVRVFTIDRVGWRVCGLQANGVSSNPDRSRQERLLCALHDDAGTSPCHTLERMNNSLYRPQYHHKPIQPVTRDQHADKCVWRTSPANTKAGWDSSRRTLRWPGPSAQLNSNLLDQ